MVQGNRPVPLSNRRGTIPHCGTGVGVDRLSLSFPLAGLTHDADAWDRAAVDLRRHTESRSAAVKVGADVQVFVGAAQVTAGGGWYGKVECNPSRLVDPQGYGLAPTDEGVAALREVALEAIGERLAPVIPLDEWRVKRLDVARDFDGVQDVPGLLTGLASVHRPWSRRNNLFNDATRKGAQTLMVGGRQSGARLYDKERETGGIAPPGTLRFEVQARTDWCNKYGGIATLRDITDASVHRLAIHRWEWSGMGTEVGTRSEVVARVTRSGLSLQQQCSFLGWLMLTSAGHPDAVSKNVNTKYRRIARQLHVALGPETLSGALVGHLDWDEGTVVSRVA